MLICDGCDELNNLNIQSNTSVQISIQKSELDTLSTGDYTVLK